MINYTLVLRIKQTFRRVGSGAVSVKLISTKTKTLIHFIYMPYTKRDKYIIVIIYPRRGGTPSSSEKYMCPVKAKNWKNGRVVLGI